MVNKKYESWKDIKGYKGYYQVSNHGHIRSMPRVLTDGRVFQGRELSQVSNGNGYLYVSLSSGNKSQHHYIHRLVAESFLLNDGLLPEVNHIDGDKSNNSVENLEWISSRDNKNHAFETGLREANSYEFENEIVADLLRGHHRNFVANKYHAAIVSIDRIIERRNIVDKIYKPNRAENVNKYRKYLTEDDVNEIRKIKSKSNLSNAKLSRRIGISESTTSIILSGKRSGFKASTYHKVKKFINEYKVI